MKKRWWLFLNFRIVLHFRYWDYCSGSSFPSFWRLLCLAGPACPPPASPHLLHIIIPRTNYNHPPKMVSLAGCIGSIWQFLRELTLSAFASLIRQFGFCHVICASYELKFYGDIFECFKCWKDHRRMNQWERCNQKRQMPNEEVGGFQAAFYALDKVGISILCPG